MDDLFRLSRSRWSGPGRPPSVLEDSRLRAFHREVAGGFAARGRLELHRLRIDGRVAAVYYGFREKARACFYLGGFAAEFAGYSPGRMLLGLMIEDVARRGGRRVDFLRGGERYKHDWGAVDARSARLVVEPEPVRTGSH